MSGQMKFPVIQAGGSPYDVGVIHGRAATATIEAEITARLRNRDLDHAFAEARAGIPHVRDWAPHLLDEMRGIADGAGVELAAILAVNRVGYVEAPAPAGCTAFIAGPDLTQDGSIYGGQNKDTGFGASERRVILSLAPEGRPSVVTYAYAGSLGHIGINSAGFSRWGMSLFTDEPDALGAKLPVHRMLLECRSVAECRQLVKAMGAKDAGAHAISDADGHCGVIEQFDGKNVWLDGGRDHAGHANAIASPDPEDRAFDREDSATWYAWDRHRRVNEILEERRGSLSVDACFDMLSDHEGTPRSICRHEENLTPYKNNLSNAGIVAEPLEGRLHISYGPPCRSPRQTVSLN